MRHFLYAVTKREPAPIGDGDAASWLRHYRLSAELETFIPMVPELAGVEEGDQLWFAIDHELCGAVSVKRIAEDVFNNRKEIWFKGSDIVRPFRVVETHLKTACISKELAGEWTKSLEVL